MNPGGHQPAYIYENLFVRYACARVFGMEPFGLRIGIEIPFRLRIPESKRRLHPDHHQHQCDRDSSGLQSLAPLVAGDDAPLRAEQEYAVAEVPRGGYYADDVEVERPRLGVELVPNLP